MAPERLAHARPGATAKSRLSRPRAAMRRLSDCRAAGSPSARRRGSSGSAPSRRRRRTRADPESAAQRRVRRRLRSRDPPWTAHIEAFLEMLAAERGARANTLPPTAPTWPISPPSPPRAGRVPGRRPVPTMLRPLSRGAGRRRPSARAPRRRSLSGAPPVPSLPARARACAPTTPPQLLDSPRLPRALPKFLSEAEVEALLAAAGRPHRPRRRSSMRGGAGDPLRDRTARHRAAGAAARRARGATRRCCSCGARAARSGWSRSPPPPATPPLRSPRPHNAGRWLFPGRERAGRSTRQGFAHAAEAHGTAPPASTPPGSRRTCSATPSPATCSPAAPTCAASSCCSATPTSPPPQIYTHVLAERLQRLVQAHHPLALAPPASGADRSLRC